MSRLAQPMFGFALLACTASLGHTAPAEKPDTGKVLGTYECHTGSLAAVTVDRPPHIEAHDTTNPVVRITVSSLDEKAKSEMKWWHAKDKAWAERPKGLHLWVKHVLFKDRYWTVTFEGASSDGVPALAMLSNLPGRSTGGSAPSERPVFIVAQLAAFFASAGAYTCDKL